MSGFSSFTGFTELRAYGTSYMADPAIIADAQGHEMFRQVAARGGITDVVSNGVSSSRLTEIAGRILGPSPAGQSTVQDASYPAGNAAGRLVLIDGITNNCYTQSGTSSITAGESAAVTEALRAMFAALGAGERIDDSDTRWTYDSNWSALAPATYCSGNSFHYAGQVGSVATCTWTQPANVDHVYFCGLGSPTTNAAGFLAAPLTLSVPGGSTVTKAFAGTMDAYSSNATNGGSVNLCNVAVRINVPVSSTPTARTLTLSVQAGGGLGVIDALLIPSVTPPRVAFLKSPPLPAGSSASSVNAFLPTVNGLVDPVVSEFSSYVHAVDWQGSVNGAYNASTMIGSDLIHPNLAGETHITDQTVADINGVTGTTTTMIINTSVLGLFRGSAFRESLPLSTLGITHGIVVQDAALGLQKPLPVVSALDPVTSFTSNGNGTYSCLWTPADSSIANNGYNNVYVVEINTATEEAQPMASRRRMIDTGDFDDVVDFGGFAQIFPPGTGSGQSGVAGKWKVTMHPTDDQTPGTGHYRYEVVSRFCPANWGGAANTGDGAMSGLVLVGSSHGYGSLAGPQHFVGDRLAFIHDSTHCAVIGGGSLQRSVFYEMGDAQSIQLAAYTPNGTGQSFDLQQCFFYADNNPARTPYSFLAHADNNNTGKFERVDVADCAFLGATNADGSFVGQGYGVAFDAVKQGTVERVYVSKFFRPLHTSNGSTMECRESVFRDFGLFFLPKTFRGNLVAAYTGTNATALGGNLGVDTADTSPVACDHNLFWHGATASSFGQLTPGSVFTNNVYVGGHYGGSSTPGNTFSPPYFAQANVGTIQCDYNLYVHLSGEFRAYYGFGYGGGYEYAGSWTAYRAQFPGLDAHSLYLDLRADARGIDAVFADAHNGDFRWAQTNVGRQCAAFCAANNVGPATVTTHWPVVPTVDETVRLISSL